MEPNAVKIHEEIGLDDKNDPDGQALMELIDMHDLPLRDIKSRIEAFTVEDVDQRDVNHHVMCPTRQEKTPYGLLEPTTLLDQLKWAAHLDEVRIVLSNGASTPTVGVILTGVGPAGKCVAVTRAYAGRVREKIMKAVGMTPNDPDRSIPLAMLQHAA